MIGTAGECVYTLVKVSRPKLSGSERSRITSAVSPADRCSSPFASRSAKCTVKGARGSSAIISRIRRASPGLSSMRRTLCTSVAVRWQCHHREPEDVDGLHHDDEFLQIHGLGDV